MEKKNPIYLTSNMDYEKAYKDALERAKEIKNKILTSHLSTESCKAVSEYIDTIIPELAESEDERIVKDLIGGLMWQRDNLVRLGPHDDNLILPGFCENVGKHLAWLEKQKLEKLIIPEKKNDVRKAIEEVIRVYGKTQGEWIAGYDMDTLVVHLRDAFAALKEQKEPEQPSSEGLEEEYKDYVENDPVYSKLVNRNAGLGIARHFAEWGAEHLKR